VQDADQTVQEKLKGLRIQRLSGRQRRTAQKLRWKFDTLQNISLYSPILNRLVPPRLRSGSDNYLRTFS